MRLLVIGGVAAGLSAAARARRIDPNLEILVLEKGDTISYGACGLPYFLEGRVKRPEDLIVYTPEYFRRERNIAVRTGAEVASISHGRREVALAGGERIRYDRLVIAAGARPDPAGIAGVEHPHVFRLNTLADAVRLKQYLAARSPRRAVIVGGGYIGLEAADALRRNGLAVTILAQGDCLLRQKNAALSGVIESHLHKFGVEVRMNTQVRSIEPDHVEGFPCDLVLLAAGLRPNTELASEAGVELGRTGALRVDERMQTNLGSVYAAGDCAEVTHLVTGRPAYIPLGTTANKMGRVAGANAAGAVERFPGVVGTSIFAVFGLGVGTTGLSEAAARREGFSPVAVRIEAPGRARYFGGRITAVELVADRTSRRLLGGVITGEQDVAGRVNVIAAALHNRMRADDFEQLDLAYSPPFTAVWDPLLICAQQLLHKL